MDSSCLLLFLLAILTALYCYLIWPYNYWKKQKVKCASGAIPGFGHVLPILLSRKSPSNLFTRLYESSSKSSMIGAFFFRTPAVLVREPELVKQVLVKDFQSFQNNVLHLHSDIDPFMAKNPFFAWDNEWKETRSKLINNMSQKKLKIFFRIMQQVSVKFEDYLNGMVMKDDSTELELKCTLLRFTAEVVANTAFGIEGGSFETNMNPLSFTARVEKLLEPTFTTSIRQVLSFYFPNLAWTLRVGFMPRSMSNFFANTVDNIVRHRNENGLIMDDLLQMIIEESDDLDPKVIAGNMSGYFFDAYDTAATIASFACFELSHNPDAQEEARREIRETLKKHDGTLNYEALKDMKYLEQVVNETIRFYPILGAAMKVCTQKIKLEGSDGHTCCLEPGHVVILPILGLHMDEKYWKDPLTFDPDRFNEKRKADVTKFAFLPFSEGPRMCAGMRYGIMMVKTILITILRDYVIEKSQKTQVPVKLDQGTALTSPAEGLWVKLKRIGKK